MYMNFSSREARMIKNFLKSKPGSNLNVQHKDAVHWIRQIKMLNYYAAIKITTMKIILNL